MPHSSTRDDNDDDDGGRPLRLSCRCLVIDAPHAPPGVGRDGDAEDALYDAGWSPVRVPAGQWAEAVAKYPSVFGGEQESV